jgi:hypothetical protein
MGLYSQIKLHKKFGLPKGIYQIKNLGNLVERKSVTVTGRLKGKTEGFFYFTGEIRFRTDEHLFSAYVVKGVVKMIVDISSNDYKKNRIVYNAYKA